LSRQWGTPQLAGRDMTGIQGNSVRRLPKKEIQEFLREHALIK